MTKLKQINLNYDLDREAAKISALSSDELENYEYLTGEDLGYKPDAIQKAKFEYSPLGKVFNKGLDESDKKERLLKRLKNIEGRNKEQLDEIKYWEDRQLDAIEKQGKKNLEAISKQEKQLKKSIIIKKELIKRVEKEEKSERMVVLRNNLDDILAPYDMNITVEREDILKKLANNERMIDYKNLFLKQVILLLITMIS